jgi:hypothetical protein
MLNTFNLKTWIPSIVLLILISGCDDGAIHIAREAADRQAQQNTAMAELNKEVASGTRQLVEADAEARKEIVGVHRELQAERTRLDTGWDALETERKEIAGQRRTESMLVPITTLVSGTVLVALLLGFCWYALVAGRRGDDTDSELNELLICEILPAESTPLLTGEQHSRSLLSHPADRPAE